MAAGADSPERARAGVLARGDDGDLLGRAFLPRIPWRRPSKPREVVRLAVYLASDEADYVAGQTFGIDGGLETNRGQSA